MADIIKRIDELAKKQNITFAALEREIGIGRGTIRRWDENCPSADKLLRVANRFDTSVEYLLTGKEEMNITSKEQQIIKLIRQVPADKQAQIVGYIDRIIVEQYHDNQ